MRHTTEKQRTHADCQIRRRKGISAASTQTGKRWIAEQFEFSLDLTAVHQTPSTTPTTPAGHPPANTSKPGKACAPIARLDVEQAACNSGVVID